MTQRERLRLAMKVARNALQPGEWERLPKSARAALVRRVHEQVRVHGDGFLRDLAAGAQGGPVPLLDEDLRLTFSNGIGESSRGESKHLEDLVKRANELGRLVHGQDPDGDWVLSDTALLDRHLVCLGTSGSGKSTWLTQLVTQLARVGGPMVLIDPHSDLIHDIIPRLPKERLKDVVYIDPSRTDKGWGINLLQVARTYVEESDPDFADKMDAVIEDSVNALVHALGIIQEDYSGHGAGVSIQSMMTMAAMAAAEREDASFVDVYQIVTDPDTVALIGDSIQRPYVRSYFRNTYPELQRRVDYIERVRNKLDRFLGKAMVNLFGRRDECPSLKQMIDENRIIMFDLDRRRLPRSVSNLIGYIIVTLVMQAVDARPSRLPDGSRPPALYLLADEFQNVASHATTTWVAEARKKNAGLIAAFQYLRQLPEDVIVSLGNASTWAVFTTTPDDARLVAPQLGLTDERGYPNIRELVDIPPYEMRLRTDEPDAQSDRDAKRRVLTSCRTLALPAAPPDAARIIDAVKRQSERFYKPTNPSDHETVYTGDEHGAYTILEAVYEAHLATKRPDEYPLPEAPKEGALQQMMERAAWALREGYVTDNLIGAILHGKGVTMTAKRRGQLRRSLAAQKLTVIQRMQSGYETIQLTPAGLRRIRDHVVPGQSRNEGGQEHKRVLLTLYKALLLVAPARIDVPVQGTSAYTPDLIGVVPGHDCPGHWFNRVTDHPRIHFEVEASSADRLVAILQKIANAAEADAEPVFVVQQDEPDAAVLASYYARILQAVRGKGGVPVPTAIRRLNVQSRPPFRLWAVDAKDRLFEVEAAGSLRGITHTYQARTPAIPEIPPKAPAPSKRAKKRDAAQTRLEDAGDAKAVFERVVNDAMADRRSLRLTRQSLRAILEPHGELRSLPTQVIDAWLEEAFGLVAPDTDGGFYGPA